MARPSWARVKEVIGAALDGDPDARESSVRRMCGDDASLRTEVQSLLLAISESVGFIESAALQSVTWPALQSGDAFGAYEVLEPLGAGGMGEVYRARDTRLNRDVALKVPSGVLALDVNRLARLTHEAHSLAALNHPHVAAIYGLEESGGIHALVLELVDGPTLADVIAHRPLPVAEALSIARQIAEGVKAAHAQGIVHRDLKPSNVKLRPDGVVKILDFGLARALDDVNGGSIAGAPASRATSEVTRTSAMFGTAAYMSPEQALGSAVDERSDTWAFGCVLYETLTGQPAFGAEAAHAAFALTGEPDWRLLPVRTPPSVQRLLRRCLDKDPARRLHDMAEAVSALDEGLSRISAAFPSRTIAVGVLAGIVALAIGVSISNSVRATTPTRAATPAVRRLLLGLPGTRPLTRAASMPLGTGQVALALSPDGTRVAYVLDHAGTRQVYLHALVRPEGQPIPGTEGALGPFFSPDGGWVGFFANNRLAKVAVSGGAAIDLGEAPNPFGGSWGNNGAILFAADEGRRLMMIPETGGEPRRVHTKDTGGSWTWPHLLPGGTAAIVSHRGSVGLLALDSGEYAALVENATDGRYAPTGHLIFAREGALFAAPFDLEPPALRGTPRAVLEGVRTEGQRAVAQAAFSHDGTLIYARGGAANNATRPVWVDRRGRVEPVGLPARPYRSFRISPDGGRVAIVIGEPNDDVWVYDLKSRALKRLTFEGTNVQPSWTPDGLRIVFTRRTPNRTTPWWVAADGSGTPAPIFGSDGEGTLASFTPDGVLAALSRRGLDTGPDLWVRTLVDPRSPQPYLRTRFTEVGPMFSPDGRWIAYVSDASGQYEVYVRAFPGPGAAAQVSTQGGEEPLWSRDGTELIYRNGNKWMVLTVRLNPTFRAAVPRLLAEGPYVNVGGLSYDITSDGERLLLLEPAPQDPVTYLNVVLNWFEEVKRQAGSGPMAGR